MEKNRFHWTFWAGVGFIIASLISFTVVLFGEATPSLIEELLGYNVGWMIAGIVLVVFSFLKKILNK
ncbi:MAG: hypothetical protein ACE5GR_02025 [Nitrosopumilus sp.]